MPYSVWQAFITDGGESIVAAASVEVLKESDGSSAALFNGPAGAAIDNPTTSSVDGLVRFYCAAGTYRLNVTKGGITKTFRHVTIGDAAGSDVGVANGVAPLDVDAQVPATHLLDYYTQDQVDALVAAAVTGLLDDRGNYDASTNLFPAAGGSGAAGAVKKGDIWRISVAGTLGGSTADVGDWVRALADAPGQTAGNWALNKAEGGGGGGGLDDAGVAALIGDASPSDTRAALEEVIEEVAYSSATLGFAVADAFSIAHATIRGNVISSSGSAQAAGLNAAVAKPVSGLVSMGEFRVDAGSSVEFIVVNASGNGMIYGCAEGQWSKTPITGGTPGSASPLAFGFGRTASVLLSSGGATILVVGGSSFSSDALFAADATINTLINLPGSAASVVYTTAGDKYVYDYTAVGFGVVTDVLGRTIKPTGTYRPVGPVLPMVVGGSNPRTYMGFADAGSTNIDTKVKFEGINLNIASLIYSSATAVSTGALVVVGAGAVLNIDTIDCGTADISTVVAVEKGGIVTVGAITGSGAITDNFNQAPMVDTVDGFIRSALTEAH